MSSILKRISPVSILDRHLSEVANVHFNLDEPDFIIGKKLKTNRRSTQNSDRFFTSFTTFCGMCGNIEISANSKFCRICGSAFSND